ncbi:CPXCG motif-containing cysteine-rich protein [Seonamhaeicola aphaedonensis]|uniref:CPXCG motif-containing cysteine-rich protein n=1 Tax=Seonamhaeicola aphaedonensis TaxID=1461338 RepID=UPI000E27C933|nr:CPXCG motif-containing cysteine-rich protein [Seonamhaeicola aphaedonensis]
MIEHYFTCPYCWQIISILIDNSIINQSYIEDCEVCCNPINISFKIYKSDISAFQADNL